MTKNLHQVCISQNEMSLKVSVIDKGPGIAAGDQEVIFESFRQLDGGHTRSHPGVGLGLAIAQQIARAHDTAIEVEAALGEGSTFSFELPRGEG